MQSAGQFLDICDKVKSGDDGEDAERYMHGLLESPRFPMNKSLHDPHVFGVNWHLFRFSASQDGAFEQLIAFKAELYKDIVDFCSSRDLDKRSEDNEN